MKTGAAASLRAVVSGVSAMRGARRGAIAGALEKGMSTQYGKLGGSEKRGQCLSE